MANTYIDTNTLPHTKVAGSGEYVEVLNNALCGAKNVVGSLRWLQAGDKYDAKNDGTHNQLVYLMEGEATITLNAKDHQVAAASISVRIGDDRLGAHGRVEAVQLVPRILAAAPRLTTGGV
jgi:hypothetical protein